MNTVPAFRTRMTLIESIENRMRDAGNRRWSRREIVRRYLSEVVAGWKRRKATEAAIAGVIVTDLSME